MNIFETVGCGQTLLGQKLLHLDHYITRIAVNSEELPQTFQQRCSALSTSGYLAAINIARAKNGGVKNSIC